jgi:hypothetical protein
MATILAIVPRGSTAAAVAITADWLAAMTPSERERFAASAGAKKPSAKTWQLVVAAARAFKPADDEADPFARSARSA